MKAIASFERFGGATVLAAVMIGASPLGAVEPARPAASGTEPIVLSLEGAPSRGRADAALTLVEFSDFQCPTSGRYSRDVFDRVQREYVDSGKVRYVFHNFPLARHPHALEAAQAAQCAGAQGRFWELRSVLFAHQQSLGAPDLLTHAKAAGVETGAFVRCLGGEGEPTVRRQIAAAARAGVTETPTLFVGVLDKDRKLHVLREIAGTEPYDAIKRALDTLLANPPPAN